MVISSCALTVSLLWLLTLSPASSSSSSSSDVMAVNSNNNEEEETPRDLMEGMTGYGELMCNMNASPKINSPECLSGANNLSSLLSSSGSSSSTVVVPCGSCYNVDYVNGETITLAGGLKVLGRLHFPSTANVVLNTTSVVVQGMWSMVQPQASNTVKISLYGADDVTVYPHDQCCDDSSGICDTNCEHAANLNSKPFAVVGGQLDIRAIDTNCPSWTILKNVDKASKTFSVDSSFASCLSPGVELLIANDSRSSSGHVRYTIVSVNSTSGDVIVSEPIDKDYATVVAGPGEAMFATEVAVLSRRVQFEGSEDEANIGAHTIIYHTPEIVQTIQGVSFKGFGQGGKLGRYPIHFHMCDNTASVVEKNVIRDSHQRCVFIHNTNYVTVNNNVAYSTKGHCYATETGYEHDNVFTNNLAVGSYKLDVTGNGQSDDPNFQPGKHQAAAFWIRNMMNTFVGNRVAGCSSSGFWLEMKVVRSNQLNEDSFKDNVAHSCYTGLLTYKKGWIPDQPAVVKNMKVYKNQEGFKFHITGNIRFVNFVSADNTFNRYGAWNEGVDFVDSTFIALSDDSKLRLNQNCPSTVDGIRASYNTQNLNTDKQFGLENVEFRNFDCNAKTITWYYDDRLNNNDMGDPLIATNVTFTGTTLEKNLPAFGCTSRNENLFMEDSDGVLGPNSKGTGFIVRNIDQMKGFLTGCEALSYQGCSAMCEGACLRLVHIKPSGGDGNFHFLTLTDQATHVSYTWTIDQSGYNAGKAILVVPKATYQANFTDLNGNLVIASTVDVTTYRAPISCNNYIESTDFIFPTFAPTLHPTPPPSLSPTTAAPTSSSAPSEAPTTRCEGLYPDGVDKVILNNGFESGGWSNFGGASTTAYTPAYSGESASAMTYSSEPGYYLPAIRIGVSNVNQCVRGGMKLGVYFKAKLLNMTDNDSPVDCNPSTNCPTARFRIRQEKPDGSGTYCNGWYHVPRSIVAWNKSEYNDVSSLWTVPSSCAGTNWAYIFLDITQGKSYPPSAVRLVVDDVKVMIDDGQYTLPPTFSPTFAPTPPPTTAFPTTSPTVAPTPAPTTSAPTFPATHPPTPIPTTAPPSSSPTTQCEGHFPSGGPKILLSTGFESSSGSGWGGGSTTQHTPGASGNYASAMTYSSNPGHYHPAIRLNVGKTNACLRGGMQLNVEFKAKLLNNTDNGSPVDCIAGINCPTARFRARQNKPGGGVYCNGWYNIPKPTTPWNKDEFNTISTVWNVPSWCVGTSWNYVKFDITQGRKYDPLAVKLLVDDVKISIKED